MNITEVRIRLIKKDGQKLKATASITIDACFVVHDLKVIETQQEGAAESLFVAMPSRKNNEGRYIDLAHPIDTKTRENLSKLILEEYEKALNAAPAE